MTIFNSKKIFSSKKAKTESTSSPKNIRGRRSFLWKMGAGASAAVASATSFGNSNASNEDDLIVKLVKLEEEKKIHSLHQSFESLMDKGQFEDVQNLFVKNAEVVFNGGAFKNSQGLKRLFKNFQTGKTGKSINPAPGFEVDVDQQQESIEMAADNLSAKASFPYSIQVGTPIESDSSLVTMARLQGEGIKTWWEGGNYQISYIKNKNGSWLINKLKYETLSRADYREGRSYAQPISVSQFSTVFPVDQSAPDILV